MKAWIAVAPGTADAAGAPPALALVEVDGPQPACDELLVAVRAIGLNRADLARRAGHYQRVRTRPEAPIVGLEAAGEVIAVGEGVEQFRVGDRVMGMPSGAYAERALLHERLAMRVPDGLDWVDAAALPVAMLTAHDALVTAGRLGAGDRVLVQGASSAVGLFAVQLARWLRASQVIGTARNAAKLDALASYGMTVGIVYGASVVADEVARMTSGHGVDVIMDMLGGDTVGTTLDCCALGARWVQVGRMRGLRAELDLDTISRKRITLVGVTFRTRGLDEFAAVVRNAEAALGHAVAHGALRMPIAARFRFDQAQEAQTCMASNAHLGKIVMELA